MVEKDGQLVASAKTGDVVHVPSVAACKKEPKKRLMSVIESEKHA